jgi:hypothetical protein
MKYMAINILMHIVIIPQVTRGLEEQGAVVLIGIINPAGYLKNSKP